jgi:hypothetical protein
MQLRWKKHRMQPWRHYGLLIGALMLIMANVAEAGFTSDVVTVPVVAVFHQASYARGEVLPAIFVQAVQRDDKDPIRVVLEHRPNMVDANYPERLEAALRIGLSRLNYDTRGLTIRIGFGGPFLFTGGSLSAAVVIGAVAALEGRALTPNLVLTGTVEEDGSIGPISDLELKIAGAGSYTVLYPSSQIPTVARQFAARPVRSLQEARSLMLP